MLYSIIWLNYDPENKKDFTQKSLESIKNHLKGYDYEILEVKNAVGYSNAVNIGLRLAKGDYIIICSDDVFIEDDNWLKALTKDNAIVGHRFVPFYMTKEEVPDGSVYGFSREVFNKIGFMDTQYVGGYGCDEVDHYFTAKENGVQLLSSPFKMKHLENATFQAYHKPNKEAMTERNVGLFYQKWHKKYELKT